MGSEAGHAQPFDESLEISRVLVRHHLASLFDGRSSRL
jgi:hypothetical protein